MIRIGVTGHRILAEVEKIEAGIAEALRFIEHKFPGETLAVVSSLAEGADRLVVRQVLARPQTRLIVPLPLPESDYLNDFATEKSKEEFRHLLGLAWEVIVMSPAPSREEAYEAAGRYVQQHCDVLVAIWDGQQAQGLGGTGGIVAEARRRNLPIAWVHAGNRRPGTQEPTTLGDEQGKVTYKNFPPLTFISAHSPDYQYAEKIYHFLVSNGVRTFFSKISLPQLGISDYRKKIDEALDEAEHMIVVASQAKHLHSPWVEAEWGLFINEKRSGRKTGNILTLTVGHLQPAQLPASLRYYEVISLEPDHLDKILLYVGGRKAFGCASTDPSIQSPRIEVSPEPASESPSPDLRVVQKNSSHETLTPAIPGKDEKLRVDEKLSAKRLSSAGTGPIMEQVSADSSQITAPTQAELKKQKHEEDSKSYAIKYRRKKITDLAITKPSPLRQKLLPKWLVRVAVIAAILVLAFYIARFLISPSFAPTADSTFKQGLSSLESKDYDQAINSFTTALQLKPDWVEAYLNRGQAYAQKDDYDQALSDFNAVLRINPEDVRALLHRGEVFLSQNQVEKAIEDIDQVFLLDPAFAKKQHNPNIADVYYQIGEKKSNDNRYDDALIAYSRAISLNPDKVWYYYNDRAVIYGHKQQYDKAIEDLNQALQLNQNELSLWNKARFCEISGRLQEAIEAYQNFVSIAISHMSKYQSRIPEAKQKIEVLKKKLTTEKEEGKEH